jgi:hypothetical protein
MSINLQRYKLGTIKIRVKFKGIVQTITAHEGPEKEYRYSCILRSECGGTRWRTGGKWRGNWRMEWVASTLHTTSERGVSSITNADAHNSAASSRLNWRPRWFKWARPCRRRTKCGFCALVIRWRPSSTLFLTSALDGMGGQRHAPAALPRYPLYRRFGWPQDRYGRVRKVSLVMAFDPRTVQSAASRYTDWAI